MLDVFGNYASRCVLRYKRNMDIAQAHKSERQLVVPGYSLKLVQFTVYVATSILCSLPYYNVS